MRCDKNVQTLHLGKDSLSTFLLNGVVGKNEVGHSYKLKTSGQLDASGIKSP